MAPASIWDRIVAEEVDRVGRSEGASARTLSAQIDSWRASILSDRETLLPYQRALVEEPGVNSGVVSTRRSGKTVTLRQLAGEAAFSRLWTDSRRPQPIVQYITPKFKDARTLFWTPFRRYMEVEKGIEAVWDDARMIATMPTGVLVRASGVNRTINIDDFRGDAYILVMIDEAAVMGPKLEGLLIEGLGMAMGDYGGRRVVTATPGQTKTGWLYRAAHGQMAGWKFQPAWNYRNNIHLPAEMKTDKWVEENLGPLTSARVRREAFGEWATDADELVYGGFAVGRNVVDSLPPVDGDWHYALGLDVGFRDPTAFVVAAWHEMREELFIIQAESHQGWTATKIVERILALKAQYPFDRIVMDAGGSMARNNLEDWNVRYGLGIVAAQKAPGYKYPAIRTVNDELTHGRLQFLAGTTEPLTKEMQELPWAPAKEGAVRHDQVREHPGYANHCCDAMLYVSRETRHWRLRRDGPPTTPKGDSPEYWADMARRDRQKMMTSLTDNARLSYEDRLIESEWAADNEETPNPWIEQ
jgi:hypothetical protein